MSHATRLATQIENALQQIFEHDANTRARETGFVQRQRKHTGSTFAQIMVFGAASNPCPTDTDWTQAAARAGTLLTPQGIEQRFTPEAAHLLYALLQRLVACVVTPCTPEVVPLLQRFAGVFIKDSTGISLPKRLREYARKKGKQPTQARLALTPWLVVVTNVPKARLSAQEVGVLARVRWQVEILFRVWKSCFRIDECRSRHVWRVLCAL